MAGARIFTGTNRSSEAGCLRGVLIDPSAAAWAVEIQDTSGKTLFQAGGAADISFYAGSLNVDFTALNVTTATNITKIICYV